MSNSKKTIIRREKNYPTAETMQWIAQTRETIESLREQADLFWKHGQVRLGENQDKLIASLETRIEGLLEFFDPPPLEEEKPPEPAMVFVSCGKVFDSKEDVPLGQLATAQYCMAGGNPGKMGGKPKKVYHYKKPKNGYKKKEKEIASTGGNPRSTMPGEIQGYYEFDLTTTASGTIDINMCVNSPTQAVNNMGVWDKAAEISRITEGYTMTEHYSHIDQIAPMVQRSGYFVFSYDPDSGPPPTSLTEREIQQNGYKKKCNAGDKIVDFMVKPKKLSSGEYVPLGADAVPAIVRSKGIYDWGTPMSDGYVYLKYVGGPASTFIGKLKIWAFFKGLYPRYILPTLRDLMYPMGFVDWQSKTPVLEPPKSGPVVEDLGEWTEQDERDLQRMKAKKKQLLCL